MRFFKIILIIFITIGSIFLFLPKQNIYYLGEYELKKYNIIISDEKFKSELLGFELNNAKLYLKGVNIATLDTVRLSLLGANLTSKEIGSGYMKLNFQNYSVDLFFKPTKKFIQKYKIV